MALVVAALACSLGLHWAACQSLAWSAMLVDNLRTAPLSAAVQRTFDGQHLCRACVAIAKGRQAEKKSPALQLLKKLELVAQSGAVPLSPPTSCLPLRSIDEWRSSRPQLPPTPPPRSV